MGERKVKTEAIKDIYKVHQGFVLPPRAKYLNHRML